MKILIIAPSWIGDAIMAQPLLTEIARQQPDAILDVVAPSSMMPLFKRMPEVHEVMPSPLVHGRLNGKGIQEMAKKLEPVGYDQAIILPNSFKSALLPWLAKIPIRRGFLGEWRLGLLNKITWKDPKKSIRLVDRYLLLSNNIPLPQAANDEFSLPRLLSSPAQQQAARKKFDLSAEDTLIALCPGAEYGPAKRWPPDYYGKLARHLAQANCQIIILGGPKDFPIGKEVEANAHILGNRIKNLCGQTTLEEAIDLLASSHLAITNDSGLMHVAAAVGCTVVAIYGSSDPTYTPPLAKHAFIVEEILPCRPCFERTCRYGHYHCLKNISPEKIGHLITPLIFPNVTQNS